MFKDITTVPNLLTLSRLAAIPFLILLYPAAESSAHPEGIFGLSLLCSIIFGAAAITDFLDGYLARKWGQESELGEILDPVCDKLLVCTGLALLVYSRQASLFFLIPMILREMYVTSLRLLAADRGLKLPVIELAKYKTTAQIVATTMLLSSLNIASLDFVEGGKFVLLVAFILSMFTSFLYTKEFIKVVGYEENLEAAEYGQDQPDSDEADSDDPIEPDQGA